MLGLKQKRSMHRSSILTYFVFARPSQDVFLLPHIPWIEQGGSILLVSLLYNLCLMASRFYVKWEGWVQITNSAPPNEPWWSSLFINQLLQLLGLESSLPQNKSSTPWCNSLQWTSSRGTQTLPKTFTSLESRQIFFVWETFDTRKASTKKCEKDSRNRSWCATYSIKLQWSKDTKEAGSQAEKETFRWQAANIIKNFFGRNWRWP